MDRTGNAFVDIFAEYAHAADEDAAYTRERCAILTAKAEALQDDFIRQTKKFVAAGVKLSVLYKEKWPKNLPSPITHKFRSCMKDVHTILSQLATLLAQKETHP